MIENKVIMKHSKFLLLIIFTLFSYVTSANNHIKFEKYSVEHGLSSAKIQCIIQDSIGFLWIGTDNGLNRFDGYTFKSFKHNPDDSTSINNNNINDLFI